MQSKATNFQFHEYSWTMNGLNQLEIRLLTACDKIVMNKIAETKVVKGYKLWLIADFMSFFL